MGHALVDVAAALGLAPGEITPWGDGAAKLTPAVAFDATPARTPLVLVSAMSPTPVGEGKTTVSIGLTDALRLVGVRAACALRQPSMGPVFGIKGGGTGGGRACLVPSARINLGLTGDLHAVAAAHNLLASLVDHELHFGAPPRLDARQIALHRAIDLDDRALRHIVVGLGGRAHGVPREDGFDIAAASEVMAILCLATSWSDLKRRLGAITVGHGSDGAPLLARDLGAHGAMAALLRDALLPNLVATSEGAPALVHGGPFGNIAHGASSLVATRVGLARAELLVTEAGFGFDLGGEKFLDIDCRLGGLWPSALVLVATLRALRYHGDAVDATRPDRDALARGFANLEAHVEHARAFGLEPIVALNLHDGDPEDELALIENLLAARSVACARVDVYRRGGEGGRALAERVWAAARRTATAPRFLYALTDDPVAKMRAIATRMYGAVDVALRPAAEAELARAARLGHDALPVCIAKTHLSLSDDEHRRGRPGGFVLTVRELRVSTGAGFLVPLAGEILTMPGLPRRPQAQGIDLADDGTITGVR